jgi:hypothetical protein
LINIVLEFLKLIQSFEKAQAVNFLVGLQLHTRDNGQIRTFSSLHHCLYVGTDIVICDGNDLDPKFKGFINNQGWDHLDPGTRREDCMNVQLSPISVQD